MTLESCRCEPQRLTAQARQIFGSSVGLLGVLLVVMVAASTGRAAPITLTVQQPASVEIIVNEGFTVQLATATTGLEANSNITIDDVTNLLLALDLNLTGGTVLNLASPFGGYDTVVLDAVSISTGSLSVITPQSLAPSYAFVATNIEVTATYSASDSNGVVAPVVGSPISFITTFNGAYDAETSAVELFGVTIGVVPGAPFGELQDLFVLGNFSTVPIPEPSTALLVGLGLAALSTRRASH